MAIFTLKLIAMLSMIVDHCAYVLSFNYGFSEFVNFLSLIGRFAFPIFAFALSEGWVHTSDKSKYLNRLCLCAIASEIPFVMLMCQVDYLSAGGNGLDIRIIPIFILITIFTILVYWFVISKKKINKSVLYLAIVGILPAFSIQLYGVWLLAPFKLNVIYTFILGMEAMYFVDSVADKRFNTASIILLSICLGANMIVYGFNADYGYNCMGVILVLALYLIKKCSFVPKKERCIQGVVILLWGIVLYGICCNDWLSAAMIIIPAILIALYKQESKEISPVLKKSFYVIYPVHLMALVIIAYSL